MHNLITIFSILGIIVVGCLAVIPSLLDLHSGDSYRGSMPARRRQPAPR